MVEVIKVEDCGKDVADYDVPIHNAIIIPKGTTNGEALCMLFPNMHYTLSDKSPRVVTSIGVASSFDIEWWNTPYRESEG